MTLPFDGIEYTDESPKIHVKDVLEGRFSFCVDWPYVSADGLVDDEYIAKTMGTISAWIPDDLEAELEAYLDDEKLDRSTGVRKLLAEGLEEWRRERALERLAAGDVTFAKAAELAGMSVCDVARLAKERDVTWVSGEHLEADLENR